MIKRLGASRLGPKADRVDQALQRLERFGSATENYRRLLIALGGAVTFDRGARFELDEPCPIARKDGSLDLEILFGLGDGGDGIEAKLDIYMDELPAGFVPIGEVPGGSLVCLDGEGRVYVWDHESSRDQEPYLAAESADILLGRLKPDEDDPDDSPSKAKPSSWIDF